MAGKPPGPTPRTIDFFYGRVSGNSARVAFALHEAKAAFAPHLIDTRAQGKTAPSHTYRLTRWGRSPSIVDGSLRLWESNAINGYIATSTP